MRKWTQSFVEIINGFLIFSTLFCMVMSQVYGDDIATCLPAFTLIPIMAVVSIGAHKAKKFWLYVVSVMVAILCAYISTSFAGTMVQRVLLLVFTAFISMSYFTARSKNRTCWLEKPEFAFLALFLALYWLAGRVNCRFLQIWACYGAGIYYLLISYYTNTMQMVDFVSTHSGLERFPEKRLLKSNRRMMWMQSGLVAAGMFIAPFVGIENIFYAIGRGLRDILAFILGGLETEPTPEKVQEAEKQSQMMMMGEAHEIPRWLEILFEILDLLSWILVIALFVYLIYSITKKLYGMYLEFGEHTEENGDKVERIYAVSSKETKMDIGKEKKENLFWDRSPNARIRKFYKKRVRKDIKATINPAWTPQEIEKLVDIPVGDKELLHTLYEKARYSKDGCSREEAQEVVNIR